MFSGAKALSFNHPLGACAPEKLDEVKLNSLVEKLRGGTISDEEKDELIEGHMRLAMWIASIFAARAPNLSDVLIAEAMYALVNAVEQAPVKLFDNKLTPYISVKIQGALFHCLAKQKVVNVPRTTVKNKQKLGEEIIIPKIMPLREVASGKSEIALYELRDMLSACVKDITERNVLDLRSKGYKDLEISEMLETSRSTIQHIRGILLKRFEILKEKLNNV